MVPFINIRLKPILKYTTIYHVQLKPYIIIYCTYLKQTCFFVITFTDKIKQSLSILTQLCFNIKFIILFQQQANRFLMFPRLFLHKRSISSWREHSPDSRPDDSRVRKQRLSPYRGRPGTLMSLSGESTLPEDAGCL